MRAPHIGIPRCTRHAGRPFIGNAAANAASDLARPACARSHQRRGAATSPSGGSAVNGTPAAVPVIGESACTHGRSIAVCHRTRVRHQRNRQVYERQLASSSWCEEAGRPDGSVEKTIRALGSPPATGPRPRRPLLPRLPTSVSSTSSFHLRYDPRMPTRSPPSPPRVGRPDGRRPRKCARSGDRSRCRVTRSLVRGRGPEFPSRCISMTPTPFSTSRGSASVRTTNSPHCGSWLVTSRRSVTCVEVRGDLYQTTAPGFEKWVIRPVRRADGCRP